MPTGMKSWAGAGDPLDDATVRAILLLRARTLAASPSSRAQAISRAAKLASASAG